VDVQGEPVSRTPAQSRKALAAVFGTIGKAYLHAQSILLEVDAQELAARDPSVPPPSKPPRRRSTLLEPVESREPVPLNGKGHANDELTKTERRILTPLAQYNRPLTRKQIAILSGLSGKSGGFASGMASCRAAGFMTSAGDSNELTSAGREALGYVPPLPEGSELFESWCAKVKTSAAKILRGLREAHRAQVGPIDRVEIAKRAGLSAGSGGFASALAKLRQLELVDDLDGGTVLSPELQRAVEPTTRVYDNATKRTIHYDRKGNAVG
jgi:hypothetical protein